MDKIGHRKKSISIKGAFAVILVAICLAMAGASAAVILGVESAKNDIRERYADHFKMVENPEGYLFEYEEKEIPGLAGFIYDAPLLVTGALIILVAIIIAVLGGQIYYNWKLKIPILELSQASERIAGNDLDFRIEAKRDDELGKLCESFEHMRVSLKYTNRKLWDSAEESKRLNAAFAHDLRTPMTVLEGYGELLESGLIAESLSKEKIQSIIQTMNKQILRLKRYTVRMSEIQGLQELSANRREISLKEVAKELKISAVILAGDKKLYFEMPQEDRLLRVDMKLIMEVFENLITNAERYAKREISVRFSIKGKQFAVIVADDGPGFSEEALQKAKFPYYRTEKERTDHFGLGLYVSETLCDIHAGKLIMSNGKNGGGEVYAIFLLE